MGIHDDAASLAGLFDAEVDAKPDCLLAERRSRISFASMRHARRTKVIAVLAATRGFTVWCDAASPEWPLLSVHQWMIRLGWWRLR